MKTYWLRFGFGDPRVYTGLAPTLLIFKDNSGTNVTPPSVAEVGSGTGLYAFSFGTTVPIGFLADAATTSPGAAGRYVAGSIDPADRADEYGNTLVAIGTTNIALGTANSAIGTTILASIPSGLTLTALGNSLVALGTTNVALSTTILANSSTIVVVVSGLGSTASSFGDSTTDPVDLFGYIKRTLEILEGNQSYIKPSGALSIYSRGSSVLLASKTITNSVTTVIKT
jgi:hypothetical protein